MTYRFLPPAEDDLRDAAVYYESLRDGLGDDFLLEIRRTIDRIMEYPDGWSQVSLNSRRCLANRFPYEVIYSLENGDVLISAVANQHRHPDYWKNR